MSQTKVLQRKVKIKQYPLLFTHPIRIATEYKLSKRVIGYPDGKSQQRIATLQYYGNRRKSLNSHSNLLRRWSKTCHVKLDNDVQFLPFFFKSIHNRISLCKSKTAWQPFEGNVLGFVMGEGRGTPKHRMLHEGSVVLCTWFKSVRVTLTSQSHD